jgi:hypothetical protein
MIWSMYNIQNDFKKRVKLIISSSFFQLQEINKNLTFPINAM